jgi:PAS domain S-box-containing protein
LVSNPDRIQSAKPVCSAPSGPEDLLFRRLTIVFGLLAAGVALGGLLAAFLGIAFARGANPEYRTIALSAALIWTILGTILAYQAVKAPGRIAGLVVQFLLILIAGGSAIEFLSSIQGRHFILENYFVQLGTVILGPSSSPISPAAAALAVVAALALVFLIRSRSTAGFTVRIRDAVSIAGLATALVSLTFVLSYTYGNPLLYGSGFIPIAFVSALAAFFTGASLIAAAGPGAVPARYFIGSSTSACLLRVFVPLVASFIIVENLIFVLASSWFSLHDAVLLSALLVVFVLATAFVIGRVSGRIGRALEKAEDELLRKNEELGNLNEELTASDEELRQNIDELTRTEMALRESEQRFRTIAEMSPVQLSIARRSDGRLLFTNPAYDRAFGFGPGELAGHKTPDLYYHHADREVVLDIFRTAGSVHNHELTVRKKDGSPFWVNLSLCAIRYAGEDALIAATVDITGRKEAESILEQKNMNLNALNEELTATQEELHQNLEELSLREEDLSKALAEKEVLLSEIHHRVKNNLTAFISLLSLEGSTEDTPAGKMLRQDLQNRARSMALVHETLYRTRLFNDVDMEMYLSTLLNQIAGSFGTTRAVKIVVDSHGVMLDIPRATPAGLITNEIVTNSFKYAFPDSFDPQAVRNAPPTISVTLTKSGGEYEMIIRDNGIGLPPGIDLTRTKSLGLKLVNFLAKHQMRADVEVISDNGTAFIFRFGD